MDIQGFFNNANNVDLIKGLSVDHDANSMLPPKVQTDGEILSTLFDSSDSASASEFNAVKQQVSQAENPNRKQYIEELKQAFLEGKLNYNSFDVATALTQDGFLELL